MTDYNKLTIIELQQKAEMGDAEAALELAEQLLCAKEEEQNSLGLKWLETAFGDSVPLIIPFSIITPILKYINLNLRSCYMSFIENEIDVSDFLIHWLQKKAESDLANAQLFLAMIYSKKELGYHNEPLAFKWFEKAAEQGVCEAQYYLGLCYHEGTGVRQDTVLGCKWIEKAAEQGDLEAQHHLGMCYLEGKGIQQNYGLALKWLTSFAENDRVDSFESWITWTNTCMAIADIYAEGKAVDRNYDLAISWYEKISNDKDYYYDFRFEDSKDQISEIKKWLSKCHNQILTYSKNQATPTHPSDRQAYSQRKTLALLDHAESQLWMANYYLHGGLLEQSDEALSDEEREKKIQEGYQEAVKWAERSMINGCREALLILGLLGCIVYYDSSDYAKYCFESAIGQREFKFAKYKELRYRMEFERNDCLKWPESFMVLPSGEIESGIAEYFLFNLYKTSEEEDLQRLAKEYKVKADAVKVWSYFQIDKLLDNDESLKGKLDFLKTDSHLISVYRELEQKNRQLQEAQKELEEMMAMFSHKFRSPLDAILYNTTHEHQVKLYTEAAQTMRGLLDVFSMISTDPEILKAKIQQDNSGNGSLLSVFSKTLDMIMLHLLSASGAEKIQQHYLAYAKSHGLCEPTLSYKCWIEEHYELEQQLQAEWEQSFAHLLGESDILETRLNWLQEHFFKLELLGFETSLIRFRANGATESFLMILLNEILVNAFKYYASVTRQPVVVEWADRDGQQVLICRNPSVRSERTIIKGSHKGHAFLSTLARKTGSQFVKPQPQDNFVLEFGIPNELLITNDAPV